MSDTGDSGTCWSTEGDGCGHTGPTRGDCGSQGSDAPLNDQTVSARVEGDGCACAGVPLPSALPLWLCLAALTLFRRLAPALLLAAVALPSWAVDAQHLDAPDGGPFVAVPNPTMGPAWSGRLTLGSSYAHTLVVLRDGSEERELLGDVWTNQGTVSAGVDQWFRVGASLPVHSRYALAGVRDGSQGGDLSLWINVSMAGDDGPLQAAWMMALDLPSTTAAESLLGDSGAVSGQLSTRRELGRLVAGGSAGVRLQRPTQLPGLQWGNRFEYSGGLAASLLGPLAATVEVVGSLPLGTGTGPGALPVELLATGRWVFSDELSLQAGAGRGLTVGLGAPDWRLLGQVALEGVQPRDSDHDGLANARDLCPSRAEDFDDWRDRDGCPDPDNDQDGLLDVVDACPIEAEVFNGLRDDDGCPDHFARVHLTVRSAEPGWLERAEVHLDGETLVVIPGEAVERELPPGRHLVKATADDHLPLRRDLAIQGEGPYVVDLVLEPLVTGALDLRLTSTGGTLLTGALDAAVPREPPVEDAPPDPSMMLDESVLEASEVPPEGVALQMPVGPSWLLLSAPGHRQRIVSVDLTRDGSQQLTVALEPLAIWMDDSALRVSDELQFAVDSAVVDDRSQAVLSLLASWLTAHPEVELLRIEGHADDVGNPRYNHALSIRRAQAVQDWLAAAGVESARLEAIGSGEALAGPGGVAHDRAVTFLVVVWDESVEAPEGDATAAE